MNISNKNSLYWRTGIDNKGLVTGTNEARGILSSFARQVTGMDVFAGLGVSAGLVMGKIIHDTTEMSIKFQHAMKEVETISVATQQDFEGMSDAIIKLSTEVPENAIGLANAFYEVASAGYDGAQALNLVDVAAKAAVGGVTDTKTAVDGLTSILNAWQLGAENATRVSDVMFKTVELGKITFEQLSHEIAVAAPLAAALGVPFEEIAGAVATLTKSGTPASVALTQVRAALIALSENLGDGWSKTMTFQEALIVLRDKAHGSDTALREMVGRIEAMNGVLALTGANAHVAAKDLEAMKNSTGASIQAFNIMANDAVNVVAILQNRFVAKLKPIGDFFSGFMTGLAEVVNDAFFEVNNDFTRAIDFSNQLANSFIARRNDIQRYIDTIELLGNKADLTAQESLNLKNAQNALNILIPELSRNWNDNAEAIDNVKRAQEELTKLSDDVLEQRQRALEYEIQYVKIQQQEAARTREETIIQEEEFIRTREELQERYTSGILTAIKTGSERIGAFTELEHSQRTKQVEEQLQNLRDLFGNAEITEQQLRERAEQLAIELIRSSERQSDAERETIKARSEAEKSITDLTLRELDLQKQLDITTKALAGEAEAQEEVNKNRDNAPPPGGKATITPDESLDEIRRRYDLYRKFFDDIQRLPHETQAKLDFLKPDEAVEALEGLRTLAEGNAEISNEINSLIAEIQVDINTANNQFIEEQRRRQQEFSALYEEYRKATSTARENEIIETEQYYDDLIAKFEQYSTEAINLEQAKQDKINDILSKHINEDFQKDYAQARESISDKSNNQELKKWVEHLQKLREKYKGHADILIQIDKEIYESQKQLAETAQSSWRDVLSGMTQIAGVVGSFNRELGDTIQMLSDVGKVADSIKMGDPLSAISAGAGILVSVFSKMFEKTNELDKLLENMNRHINEQRRAFERAYGQEQITQLQQLIDMTRQYMILVNQRTVRGSSEDRLKAYDEYLQLKDDLINLTAKYQEILTGTTRSAIADGIFQGFEEGKSESEIFAENFGEMMRRTLLDSFKRKLLTQYLDQWYDLFAQYSEDNLTPEEINTLEASFRTVVGWGEAYWKQIQNIMESAGLNDIIEDTSSRKGLSGAISGMSEETAGLLAGQFNAIRVNTVDLIDIAERHLLETSKIVDNTKYNRYLESIDRKLGVVTSNTDLARQLGG